MRVFGKLPLTVPSFAEGTATEKPGTQSAHNHARRKTCHHGARIRRTDARVCPRDGQSPESGVRLVFRNPGYLLGARFAVCTAGSEKCIQLLGTSFVQGWMEGEVVKQMGYDGSAEFWDAMVESEMLNMT